jgi:hypothetical protein
MIKPKCDLFTPDKFNAVSDIFAEACGVDPKKLGAGNEEAKSKFYEFVSETPYATMIVRFTDAMTNLGYELTEINKHKEEVR